ncbi:MAG: glycosyltransferase family A protein [Lacibacter sp.]
MATIVSIITPSFNRADIVHETAESIFNQTYPHWEWIIVDDGSTDDTWKLLEGYAANDSRVKIAKRSREPKGACTCRNTGVDIASGEYVMFLDTDDLIEPFCLQNRVDSMLAHPELDFGIFPSLMFSKKPHDLNLWWNTDKPVSELKRQFYQDAIAQGTGILIKKESFIKVGKWDEQLHLWQDIDLFFRLYIQGYQYRKFFQLPPDLHNRVNEKSLSRSSFLTWEKLKSRIAVVKNTVALLKQYQKTEFITEARYMLAEIVSGLARTGRFTEAGDFVNWGKEEKVISAHEMNLLKNYMMYYRFKLYKIPFLKFMENRVYKELSVENTLGKLKYQS